MLKAQIEYARTWCTLCEKKKQSENVKLRKDAKAIQWGGNTSNHVQPTHPEYREYTEGKRKASAEPKDLTPEPAKDSTPEPVKGTVGNVSGGVWTLPVDPA